MKKAVITTGGKQYLVHEGELLDVELVKGKEGKISFDTLLVLDGDTITIGAPLVDKVQVKADIVAEDVQANKVTSIRYKAKKRVHTIHGHRQHQTKLKITSIA